MPQLKVADWLPLAGGAALLAIALVPLYWYNVRKRPLTPELSDELYARLQKEWRRMLQEVREIQDHAPVRGSMDEKRQEDLYSIILNYCEPSMADAAHNLAAEENVTLEDLDAIVKERKPNFFDNDLCNDDGMVAVPPVPRSSVLTHTALPSITAVTPASCSAPAQNSCSPTYVDAATRHALAPINVNTIACEKASTEPGHAPVERICPSTSVRAVRPDRGGTTTTHEQPQRVEPICTRSGKGGKEREKVLTVGAAVREDGRNIHHEEDDDEKSDAAQVERELVVKNAKVAYAEKEKHVLQRLGALWRERKAQIDRIRSPTPRDIMAICVPDNDLARECALLENDEEFVQKKQELWAHIYS